jgi:alginate O-acetyltransferase complex protein AlgJ
MKLNKITETSLALIFAIMIGAPALVDGLGHGGSTASIEKREAASKPDGALLWSSFSAYTNNFENYFNDSFSLRGRLIRWNNLMRLKLFDESRVKGVRVGRDGWLFYADEWALEDYENVIPYRPEDLVKIRTVLEQRRVWLEQRGISFFAIVPPNTQTIYPEYLPPAVHKLGKKSRLDQVAEYLKAYPEIELVDVRGALLNAKGAQRLYNRTDSHWNDYGAFIAYDALMQRVEKYFPNVKRLAIEDFTVKTEEGKGGDLARMLSLDEYIKEERITLVPRFTPKATDGVRDYEDPVHHLGREMVVKETRDTRLPKALVFRDSYSWGLIPCLAESFQSVVFLWTFEFLPEIIEREKPDIVILESVERYINALTIENPEKVKTAWAGGP